jgi:large subunit ribosomal protein L2
MAIKVYNPRTPSLRQLTTDTYDDVTKNYPEKSLLLTLKKSAGRNNTGRITVRHRGGGNRNFYRIIDFRRDKLDIPATVVSIEYDPNRSSRICLVRYKDGEKRYIICPNGLKVGDVIISSKTADIKTGNAIPLKNIPLGTVVHNVELYKNKGAQLGRSAGGSVIVMAKEGLQAHLKLPSGEIRLVDLDCMATIGQVSNLEHENLVLGKAGRKRWLGIKPTVRGMCMNPCDHPHGGGEGRSKGNNHPVSFSNVPTKGYKTRNNKKSDRFILKRRK